MLDVLPLPIIWLGAYCAGRALEGNTIEFRRTVIAFLSVVGLVLGCGLQTASFYLALSGGILLAASLIQRLDGRLRQLAFAISVAGITMMIVAFLGLRTYMQKYFLYLPSLSYLGFRGISYLTSVYRREKIAFSTAAMQLLFFPMLFTGPISRPENFEASRWNYNEVLRRLNLGLAMLIAGYLLKELILPAHLLFRQAAAYIPWWIYWRSMLANSFELYFTFAGYSHLVIGLGLLVGFQLPDNFNNPYLATSIGEFWRNWHMSLSYWIRDYLYIPLGGNRYGLTRKCLHLMFAMGICGIWHGLTMNFLVWGLFHGALLCIESVCAEFKFQPLSALPDSVSRPIRVIRTFSLVTFGWLLFMYPLPAVWVHLKGLIP